MYRCSAFNSRYVSSGQTKSPLSSPPTYACFFFSAISSSAGQLVLSAISGNQPPTVRWFAAAAGRWFHQPCTEKQQPRSCQRWTSLDWLHVLLSISVNLSAVNNGLITRQHDTLEETVRCYKQWVVSALLFCRHLSSPAHGESRTYADAALVPFLSLYN